MNYYFQERVLGNPGPDNLTYQHGDHPDDHGPDEKGNSSAREGVTLCPCGSQLWVNDACAVCGTSFEAIVEALEDARKERVAARRASREVREMDGVS